MIGEMLRYHEHGVLVFETRSKRPGCSIDVEDGVRSCEMARYFVIR
jgi:hypothetical protein